MKSDDKRLVYHILLAFAVVIAGLLALQFIGNPGITANAVGAGIKEIDCINVANNNYQNVDNKEICCGLIKQTDRCELLDGVMHIAYNSRSKTSEPDVLYDANYLCHQGTDKKIYFSFELYEYCELNGYKLNIN